MRKRPWSPPLVLAGLLALGACASSVPLGSAWREAPLRVDGDPAEWKGSLQALEDAHLSVGAQNDADRLYLCLVSADPTVQAQILGSGLILWFDDEGKHEKRFGIRYPIGAMEGVDPGERSRYRERRGTRGAAPDMADRREWQEQRLESQRGEVRFLSSDNPDGWTMPVDELTGVDLAMAFDGPRLVYEMSVPLEAGEGWGFALHAQPPHKLGVGIETPEMEAPEGRQRGMDAGMGMGGGPGGMGAGPGNMGGTPPMRRGPRGNRPESIKVWLDLKLDGPR